MCRRALDRLETAAPDLGYDGPSTAGTHTPGGSGELRRGGGGGGGGSLPVHERLHLWGRGDSVGGKAGRGMAQFGVHTAKLSSIWSAAKCASPG